MASDPERYLLQRCDETCEQAITDARDAIRIPGVSKTATGLEKMSRWLQRYLIQLGAEVTTYPGQIAPIVEGLIRSPGGRPKLIVYTR